MVRITKNDRATTPTQKIQRKSTNPQIRFAQIHKYGQIRPNMHKYPQSRGDSPMVIMAKSYRVTNPTQGFKKNLQIHKSDLHKSTNMSLTSSIVCIWKTCWTNDNSLHCIGYIMINSWSWNSLSDFLVPSTILIVKLIVSDSVHYTSPPSLARARL